MSVVKTGPVETTITLDDGQIVAVTLLRDGFDVGMQEELAEALNEIPFLTRRDAKLSQAVDEATTDAEFDDRIAALKAFRERLKKIAQMIDLTIVTVVQKWDLCLTEEDEKAGNVIPLTREAIAPLSDKIKQDIFGKVTASIRGRTEGEKKDSPVSLPADSQTPMESKEQSLRSTLATSSPSGMDNDPMQSSAGLLTN